MAQPYIQISHGAIADSDCFKITFRASNGSQTGVLEQYISAHTFTKWADALEVFPRHRTDVYVYEAGSEYQEDLTHIYFRIRLFTIDSVGHCAIQFRMNNNQSLPDREITEFCIKAEHMQVNELGRALRKFSELKHDQLMWTPSTIELSGLLPVPKTPS